MMLRTFAFGLRGLMVAAALMLGAGAPAMAASDVIQQVKLTDKMVEGFIASQKDMAKVAEKLQGAPSDKPDPKIQAELETVAKKHGFKDFAEYDDVAANISMIMAGIDPQNGSFMDPVEAIKKEIEEVKVDKTIKENDRKTMLEELTEALKVTQPIKFPDNVALIKKYREKIDAVLQ
jgi:soluble P-type ATPase